MYEHSLVQLEHNEQNQKINIRTIGFLGGSGVKNPPVFAGDAVLMPGPGRPPGEEMATHFNILTWKSPCIEEPGRL